MAVVMPLVVLALFAGPVGAGELSKTDAQKLATYRARDAKAVGISIVSRTGEIARVAALVTDAGGVVRFRANEVDFLSADLSLDQILPIVSSGVVEAAQLDEILDGWEPVASRQHDLDGATSTASTSAAKKDDTRAATVTLPTPEERSRLPLDKPYPFLNDLDAAEFRAQNATFDGRGVVVAQVEGFADFLSAELRSGLDVEGRSVPKFKDIINIRDAYPSLDASPPTSAGSGAWMWVRLGPNAAMRVSGRSYRVPQSATRFRLGQLEIPARYLSTINLPGDRGARSGSRFGVFWDDQTNSARIDTNQNYDFSDDEPVVEFRRSPQIGVLGVDDLVTAHRDTLGYAVQRQGDFLALNFGLSSHATMVAGDLAANASTHGRISGIAPGVQIVAIVHGFTTSTMARSLITAFSDVRTDLVLFEGRVPITGMHRLKDERSMLDILLRRLVDKFAKPCVFTGDNDTGVSTVMDPHPSNALVVGAAQSRGVTLAHFGLLRALEYDLSWAGGEGPTGNGQLKPDLLAPQAALSLDLGFSVAGQIRKGQFALPSGYQIGGGTSQAAPIAAGALALLISAGKQTGTQYSLATLNRALRESARFLPEVAAHAQGHGLIQVAAAWRYLKAYADEPTPPQIDVEAPVRTVTSERLTPAHVGSGLFEREGWSRGARDQRSIRVVRRSGQNGPMTFALSWLGNEHRVFEAPGTVTLDLNKPVSIPFTVTAQEYGALSAVLQFRNPTFTGAVHSLLCTIVVPYELGARGEFSVALTTEIDRGGRKNVFVRVPDGAQALNLQLEHSDPYLLASVFSADNEHQAYVFADPASGQGRVAFSQPQPGVWQVAFSEQRDLWEFDAGAAKSVPANVVVRLRASAHAIALQTLPTQHRILARNTLAPTSATIVESALGSARRIFGEIGTERQRMIDLEVAPGTEFLYARVAPRGKAASDLDLYLFDCTQGSCIPLPRRSSRSLSSEESILIDRPVPGHWKVVIDVATNRAGQETQFQYTDILTHPRFGNVSNTDIIAARTISEPWQVEFNVWNRAEIARGDRFPVVFAFARDTNIRSSHPTFAPFPKSVSFPWNMLLRDWDPVSLGISLANTTRHHVPPGMERRHSQGH